MLDTATNPVVVWGDGYPYTFSGPATLVMYPGQEYLGSPMPDFDVYFFSNYEDVDEFRYYSRRFYFDDEEKTDIHPLDSPPLMISDPDQVYTPPGQDPIYYYLMPKAPVGAAFNWKSEMVAYKYWAQSGLHHIWGRYEFEPENYTPPPNQPPVVVFIYDPQQGDTPLTVEFDNYSHDLDGWIKWIECDWNADQEIDEIKYGNPSVFWWTFTETGYNDFILTVVDDDEEKVPFYGEVYVQ
jgi:hypothetical protein